MQAIPRRRTPVAILLGLTLAFGAESMTTTTAQQPAKIEPTQEAPSEQTVDKQPVSDAQRHFVRRVLPLLEAKCWACHGGKPQEVQGELLLTSRAAMLKGGESGEPAVIPGDADASPLIRAARWQDLEMPPKENDRLTQQQIADLASWVRDGAVWPEQPVIASIAAEKWEESGDGVRVAVSEGLSPAWTDRGYQRENLWAYQPLAGGPPPGDGHPVNAYLNARLSERGLAAAPPADRQQLLRRATFDLIGLPPKPHEVADFRADPRGDDEAFASVIQRLLSSPHYGERWGRHWLDVVRYADSAGLANDYARPHAWRYRDYVIRSFNNDKPYNQFVREQLAGDEIDETDPELLVATGFLRMGPWELTGMEVARVARQRFLDDVTDTVGQVFLSHPLQCARCHDHKFDPIPTRDYYSLQAVFQTTQFAERPAPFLKNENVTGFEERRYLLQRRKTWQRVLADIHAKNRRAEEAWYAERKLPWSDRQKAMRQGKPEDQIAPRHVGLEPQDLGLERIARKGLERLAWQLDAYEPYALAVYDGASVDRQRVNEPLRLPKDRQQGVVEAGAILVGGDPFARGAEVAPGVMSVLDAFSQDQTTRPVAKITTEVHGRRLDLANWLTDPANALAARSIANRVWAWHFGKGLAGNPNNFGAMGQKPTHPELLDFLARYLRDHDWSLHSLHRLIMTSAAYRRSSTHPSPQAWSSLDPEAALYAVFPSRRLTAEEIRDAMLSVSGELNPAIGGIPARPEMHLETAFQPRQVMGTFAEAWQPSPRPEQRHRRSVYVLQLRGLRDPFMESFDQPTPDLSCELRPASTVAPQALSLFNSQQVHARALAMAHRVLQETASDDEAVTRALELAWSRTPTRAEIDDCLSHWRAMTPLHRETPPQPPPPPQSIQRNAVEENTGERFSYDEPLEFYQDFTADLQPADVDAQTRTFAEVCLVVLNSNEFLYLD